MPAKLRTQFKLLLWKNYRLITRHFYMLSLCVLMALFLLAMMFIERVGMSPVHKDVVKYPTETITELNPLKNGDGVKIGLSYCPENEFLGNIIKSAAAKLNLPVLALPNEHILELHLLKNITIAGIVFEDDWRNINTYPSNLTYKLRVKSKIIKGGYWYDYTNWFTGDRNPSPAFLRPEQDIEDTEVEPYFSSNFIQIQHALFLAYMEFNPRSEVDSSVAIPDIVMKAFPKKAYIKDDIWSKPICRYIVIFIFAIPSTYLSQFIAVEKKKQFKMITATIGVPNWLHWMSWYISATVFLLLFMTALLIFYKITWHGVSVISSNINTWVLFTFLLVNVIAYVAFSFMVGIFFSDWIKLYITSFLFHLILVPSFTAFIQEKYQDLELGELLFLSLFMNFAAAFAMIELAFYEANTYSLDFRTMYRVHFHKKFCFGYALNMLLLDFIIYLLITLYVEQLSLQYPRKWHFPISMLFRKCKDKKNVSEEKYSEILGTEEKHAGIYIDNLNVEINHKVVLRKLSVTVYEGELTVIYGHNGSGKSALAAVMAGILPPTSGTVIIGNYNIQSRHSVAKRQIGYCPSNDVLLNELTVEEHIWLCSRLKGSEEVQTEQELRKYTSDLGLERNLQTMCGALLLTEKNMVILCTTLCGGSRVIICDEPAKGLDPTSKDVIWNLLRMERMNKTIVVLSKTITKEINTFADRAGILIRGELRGYGELNFFANTLGRGYELVCFKEDHCETVNVTDFVRKFVPNIEVEQERNIEIVYFLSGISMPNLAKLITEIDQQKITLGLNKFSLRRRLTEEIMLSHKRETGIKPIRFPELHLIHDLKLTQRRWRAMLFKKLVFTVARFWMLALAVSVICILYAFMTSDLWKIGFKEPSHVKIALYPEQKVIVQVESNLPAEEIEKRISKEYIDQAKTAQLLGIKEDIEKFMLKDNCEGYLVGVTISKEKIIAWFNNLYSNIAPVSLNLVHNAILNAFCGSSYYIFLKNAPLPPDYTDQLGTTRGGENIGLFFTLTLAIIAPLCVIQLLVERSTGYKSFQLNTGLQPTIYWASSMLWDYFMLMVIALILMVSVCVFTIKSPFTLSMIGVMCVVYMVYGFAAITSSYFFSCFFMEANSTYLYLCAFNIITGFSFITFIHYFTWLGWKELQWILFMFPHYACGLALSEVFQVTHTLTLCNSICEELGICEDDLCSKIPYCCKEQQTYFALKNQILWAIIYMMAVGALFLILFILYEICGVRFYCACFRKSFPIIESPYMDQNAAVEALRISLMTREQKKQNPVLFDNVSVFYRNFQVLNQVTFSVSPSEIFGIVGPPGSGKTTIINLLTSNSKPTFGEIFLNGKLIEEAFKVDISCIGYCPEGGGLDGYLTGRDALHICCLLRGIRDQDLEYTYGKVVKFLGIKKLLDTEIRFYNESDKKMLSVAMSVLGNVNIIFLDEPTYGCDPASIRKICDLIEILQTYGKTVIFTTASVVESVFLCNRVVLLVNGEIFSLGSPSELDASLESGVGLLIKFNDLNGNDAESNRIFEENIRKAKHFIEEKYPDIILRTERFGILHYIMYGVRLEDWPSLIEFMEYFRATYNIKNYEISGIDIANTFTISARRQQMVRKRKGSKPFKFQSRHRFS